MTFISYAQNYEDVILWRALKHIEKGFYIDVGAMDPTFDSVTKAFYDSGWRGINIEPVQQWFNKLVIERPEDINLQIAIGDKEDIVDFYKVVDTGLSALNEEWVIPIAEERGFTVEHNLATMKTLTSICEKFHVREIQFLKIDTEGAEYLVLKGFNLKKFRPWIILIESTIPNSQIENYSEWEPLLTNNGYRFVYFDGLNRFYVAEEQSSLADQLAIPPNVFDDFITRNNFSNINELTNAKSNLALMQSDRDQIQADLNTVQADRERIRAEMNTVQADRDRTRAEMSGMRTDIQGLRIDLENVRSERNRQQMRLDASQAEHKAVQAQLGQAQAGREALQAQLNQIQTELKIIQAERDRIQTDLNAVQSDRDRVQAELNALQSDRDQIQAELTAVQSVRDRVQAELNALQSDRDQIRAELDTIQSDRDRVQEELFKAYNSRSFRITKPLREIAWFFRRLPGNFQRAKYSTRLFAFSLIHSLRMFPLFYSLGDYIKKTRPVLWARIRNKLLNIQTPHYINKQPTSFSSDIEMSEDEQYFLNLFQHEIERRKHSIGG